MTDEQYQKFEKFVDSPINKSALPILKHLIRELKVCDLTLKEVVDDTGVTKNITTFFFFFKELKREPISSVRIWYGVDNKLDEIEFEIFWDDFDNCKFLTVDETISKLTEISANYKKYIEYFNKV